MRIIWLFLIVLVLSPGCHESQQTWGRGDPPAGWRGYFGNDNNARLNFVQTQTIDRQARAIAELAERVRRLEMENPAELARRVLELEERCQRKHDKMHSNTTRARNND